MYSRWRPLFEIRRSPACEHKLFQFAQLAVSDRADASLGAQRAGVAAGPKLEVRPARLPRVGDGANFRVVLRQVHDQLGDSGFKLAE